VSDAASIVEQIKRGRALLVTVGRWKFHARRPTDMEAGELFRDSVTVGAMSVRFVDGWEGMRLCDLVGGEDESPVEFDRSVWEEWIVDRHDVYQAVGDAIMTAFVEYSERQREDKKN